jgi:DNA-binding transcriptional regulator YiaG
MKNIIYALFCPIRQKPVYVGLSTKGITRPFEHISEKSHSIKVNTWISYLKSIGEKPILVILEKDINDTEILKAKEKFWINHYISEGNLLLNLQSISSESLEALEFEKSSDESYISEIGDYVKARRKLLKLTQKELANKIGLGLRFIREVEQKKKKNFYLGSINYLLNCLGRVRLGIVSVDKKTD